MKSVNKNIFSGIFSGTLGFLSAYILIGLIALIFFGSGYYIIDKYNKKNTKLLREIQPMQYLGIVLCIIGCLPFIKYFFMSFLLEGGTIAADNLFN
jgi:hypothetical protein